MKEFFQLANRVLRIKRNHPVVSKVQKLNGNGEVEVIDDKNLAEQAIAEYFTQIYRRPEHMALLPSDIIDEEMTDEDEVPNEAGDEDLDQLALFSTQEIDEAAKESNFNKGLGPDCFDGNVLKNNADLRRKMVYEITEAMNSQKIPRYLRCGRLVPLQKT